MSRRDFFIVALKFLAICGIFSAIFRATSIIYSVGMISLNGHLFPNLSYTPILARDGAAVLLLVIFILVIFKRDRWLAEKIIPVDAEVHLSAGKNWQKELFTITLRILGLLDLVKYFPLLLGTFIEMPTFTKLQEKNAIGTVVFYLIMTSIAVYLVMGARHFTDWVFRQKSTKPPEPAPESAHIPIPKDILRLQQLLTLQHEEEPKDNQPDEPEGK